MTRYSIGKGARSRTAGSGSAQARVAERPVVLPPAWQWEHVVKNLILFLAVLCGGATVVAFMASTHAAVAASWTSQLCRATSPLCHSPVTLGLATAGLVSLWIFAAFLSMFDSA